MYGTIHPHSIKAHIGYLHNNEIGHNYFFFIAIMVHLVERFKAFHIYFIISEIIME